VLYTNIAVNYAKFFMKLATGVNYTKLFSA
jgi:hypothetical protein